MSGTRLDWSDYLEARVDDQVERMDRDHAAINAALESLKAEQSRVSTIHRFAAWSVALCASSMIALGTWLVRTTLIVEERAANTERIAISNAEQLRSLSSAVARIEGKLE